MSHRFVFSIGALFLCAFAFLIPVANGAQMSTWSAPGGPRNLVIVPTPFVGTPIPVVASASYRYDAPPSISRDTYIWIWCTAQATPACDEAGTMYDILVAAGIDPVIEAGQAGHETSNGLAGVGVPSIKNLHGVQCFVGDGRIGDSSVPWGNGCAGRYATYADAVRTWARVITNEYIAEGRNTPELVVAKYAPGNADGNNPPAYIASMKSLIDQWRKR